MHTVPPLSDYRLGGYFLSRLTGAVDCTGTTLRKVSLASDHSGRRFVPDDWTYSWVSAHWSDRLRAASPFGMTEEDVRALVSEVTDGVGLNVEPYSVCCDLDSARRIHDRFLRRAADIELWGVGLHTSLVPDFTAFYRPLPALPGFAPIAPAIGFTMVQKGAALAPGGELLGHELLISDGSGFNSVESRHGDEVELLRAAGAHVNEHGLISDFATAVRLMDFVPPIQHIAPGGWFPWLIVRYPLERPVL